MNWSTSFLVKMKTILPKKSFIVISLLLMASCSTVGDPDSCQNLGRSYQQKVIEAELILRGKITAASKIDATPPQKFYDGWKRPLMPTNGIYLARTVEVTDVLKGDCRDAEITVVRGYPTSSFSPTAPDCTYLDKECIFYLAQQNQHGWWVDEEVLQLMKTESIDRSMPDIRYAIQLILKQNVEKESLINSSDLIVLASIDKLPFKPDREDYAIIAVLDVYKGSIPVQYLKLWIPSRSQIETDSINYYKKGIRLLYLRQDDVDGYRIDGAEAGVIRIDQGCIPAYSSPDENNWFGMTLSEYRKFVSDILHGTGQKL